jgi:diguanylate cyclase (GGDEF)-like protein
MAPRTDPQDAAARFALLKHLPARLATVRRRGRQLLHFGWDVNAAALMNEDAAELEHDCRDAGETETGQALVALQQALAPALRESLTPDEEGARRFARLVEDMEGLAQRAEKLLDSQARPADVARPTADEPRRAAGVSLQVSPPVEFVQRYARPPPQRAATAAAKPAPPLPAAAREAPDVAAPVAAVPPATPLAPVVVAAPAPPARAAAPAALTRNAYHLTDHSPLAGDLDRLLGEHGYTVEHVEDPEELKEVLQALAPNLVIVDARFLPAIEDIGESLRAARTRATSRIHLVALADRADVSARLRAMRAGADSFLAQPSSAADVLARIQELFEADSADPFRVMIIEDDRSQALFAESILKKAGMETKVVLEPLKAMDELEQFRPELILMDLYMPDCDGMELTALIRERDEFANTPVVFLTGEHDSDKRFDALNAGGDDYLEKPIRPKYLISAVTNRVRRARQLSRRVGESAPVRERGTGLFNRTHLLERLAEVLGTDEGTHHGGLLFVILDGGQALRDRSGLAAFDQLMVQAGKLIAGMVGGAELAARFADSSYVVLCPTRSEQELLELGESLRARLASQLFEVGDRSLALAPSVGIATFAQTWPDANAMLNAAERACSQARSSPDRKVRLFESAVTVTVAGEGDALGQQIRDALKQDSFQLMFQPIASLRGTSEEMFQVLLRLRADDGKLYSASALIPAAQAAGLINGVDRWVLSRCLMVIHERQRQERPLRLFVSQSVDALLDPQRVAWVAEQLEQRRIPGERLVLEFRHADVVSRLRQVATFWEGLQPTGVRLCIAGFEATMAAYQALQHLPVEFLKVAPKYVSADGSNASLRQELRQVVNHARERNIRVIAPQVEDAGTAAQLWSSGADFIQGNFVQAATAELEFDFRASAL